ncbi:DNA sulfur modification protein DndD [Bermanella marisrubri]|uniref:ATPase involved in DNA repair n=1 Tax=Bermanella marisrubri TaxID=207949 RepID=Q1N4B3_9GAMM|nr:DNA sulfur modification protein DndD [Bermanella marisrubri]EAT12952.1 ATPase involved in DNA repair [Oceanobacter sp. RED65] [Bermanella marisrubri]QIZ82919.1 DNA sulfur modification protein DndD [Bermanella marisrubri]
MILNTLTLQDFGVFNGYHEINLEPKEKYNRKRPIILFGGLNGAGKTTTLTAVRLALYGKQSLGKSVSQAKYEQYLADSIHKGKAQLVPATNASVGLSFTYGKHGVVNEYKVIRSWEIKGSTTSENLVVEKDGEPLSGSTNEQLQSFLSELIPIGVADLFFFDGEKIAELAEDNANEALADAINRLLGLDIVERLRADLGIYLREHAQQKLPKDISAEIKSLENQYQDSYKSYQDKLDLVSELKTKAGSVEADIEALNARLNDLGGAWAKTKEKEEHRVDRLVEEKNRLKSELTALFSEAFPLSLAPNTLNNLIKKLDAEKQTKSNQASRAKIELKVQELKAQLGELDNAGKVIDDTFSDVLDTSGDVDVIHDISDSDYMNIQQLAVHKLPEQLKRFKKLTKDLEEIESEISAAADNIARAPDESRLKDILDELGIQQKELGKVDAEIQQEKDNAKARLRAAIDTMRKLKDLDAKYSTSMSSIQGVKLASDSRELLLEFGRITKDRKIELLEQEFIKSFGKLARKDDMEILAKIDPKTFSVTLKDKHGKEINKKKLSAGEKQIFAIAMLEALGRTSGRNLPVIIDTPLGRLDSHHRTKLVKNYFPTASHQVLILSTDTEIDESFYKDLSPEISHAFYVDYDPNEGSSKYTEGYFWRK